MADMLKKTKMELLLLIDIDMLLITEKKRGAICHAVDWYVKTNIVYTKDYTQNKEVSYIMYWDANNLYEVDVEVLRMYSTWFTQWSSIFNKKVKIKKCQKLVCNLYIKEKCIVHIKTLRQALNHELISKTVHRIIRVNQNEWLKPYIDMNTKKILKKTFF